MAACLMCSVCILWCFWHNFIDVLCTLCLCVCVSMVWCVYFVVVWQNVICMICLVCGGLVARNR